MQLSAVLASKYYQVVCCWGFHTILKPIVAIHKLDSWCQDEIIMPSVLTEIVCQHGNTACVMAELIQSDYCFVY